MQRHEAVVERGKDVDVSVGHAHERLEAGDEVVVVCLLADGHADDVVCRMRLVEGQHPLARHPVERLDGRTAHNRLVDNPLLCVLWTDTAQDVVGGGDNQPDDVADALAIAVCHGNSVRYNDILKGGRI